MEFSMRYPFTTKKMSESSVTTTPTRLQLAPDQLENRRVLQRPIIAIYEVSARHTDTQLLVSY